MDVAPREEESRKKKIFPACEKNVRYGGNPFRRVCVNSERNLLYVTAINELMRREDDSLR